MRNACRILLEKPQRKRPLGRPRRNWVNNIRIDLGEIGWSCLDCIDLAQDRDQRNAFLDTNEPSGSIKYW
jgi:hypothetical protein